MSGSPSGERDWGLDRTNYLRIIHHIETRMKEYPYGGTREDKIQFFSDLDDSYRVPEITDPLLEWLFYPNLVLTGQFGEYVLERLKALDIKKNYILINGKLREGVEPEILRAYYSSKRSNVDLTDYYNSPGLGGAPSAKDDRWILLDDSHYSGRTRLRIDSYLRQGGDPFSSKDIRQGGFKYPVELTVCIYNGAKRWYPHVNAIYHWYMIHGLEEFPVLEPIT